MNASTCGGGDPSPLRVIADQYLDDLSTRARPTTVAAARHALERLVGEIVELDLSRVMAWRQKRLQEGASNKTVNNDVGALRAALALAVRLGQLEAHPLAGLRQLPIGVRHQHRRVRALTDDEARSLLRAARDTDEAWSMYVPREPFVRALLETGARYGELAQATWSDFDRASAELTLREETTKTDRTRTLVLSEPLSAAIQALDWRQARVTGRIPGPGSRIFLAPRGEPWGKNTAAFLRQLRDLYQRAGIALRDDLGRVVHVHALRHTFATRLARHGVPLATAQLMLGHSTPTMLLRVYAHVGNEDARNALRRLPPLSESGSLEGDQSGSAPSDLDAQSDNASRRLAPRVGLEPTTTRLTAGLTSNLDATHCACFLRSTDALGGFGPRAPFEPASSAPATESGEEVVRCRQPEHRWAS